MPPRLVLFLLPILLATILLAAFPRPQPTPARTSPVPTTKAPLSPPATRSPADTSARPATALPADPFGGVESWTEILRQVRDWAAEDEAGALTWAAGLSVGEERRAVQAEICRQLSEKDPAAAVALAARLGLGEADGDRLRPLVGQWAARDLPAALAWTLRRPAGESRDEALAAIAGVLAPIDPAAAGQLVAGQISPGAVQFASALDVLDAWAPRDPAGAAGWVEIFPEGGPREEARKRLGPDRAVGAPGRN